MRLPRPRRAIAVLLAMTIALAIVPGVGWADDDDKKKDKQKQDQQETTEQQTITPAGARPDLELTGGDFNTPDNRRVIKFTVKNVGTAPSSATTMLRVVTSKPEPTPHFREIPLPPKTGLLKPGESGILNPGESADVIYSLAAECNGHVVQALVNDPLDLNPANNSVEDKQVCLPAPPPDDGAIVVGPAPRVIPEHLRPGPHTPVIDASSSRTFYNDYFRAGHNCGLYDRSSLERGGYAGWLQTETYDYIFGIETRDCAYVAVAWLFVNFPYERLDGIAPEWISRAYLTFQEHESIWRDNGGTTGCITTLDFTGGYHRSGPPRKSFLVTEPVAQQVARSPEQRHFYEFRLRGAFGSTNDLQAEGSSSCLSRLDKIQLQVYYEVP